MKRKLILNVITEVIIALVITFMSTFGMAGNTSGVHSMITTELPTITEPTVSMITNNSAFLGGNITDDGGMPITERGTIWSIYPGVQLSDNALPEGDLSTGIFTQYRNMFPAKTRIYFKAYVTNSLGTTTTTESNFFTLADEPESYPLDFSANAISHSAINLTWTSVSGADGYIVIMKNGASAPVSFPEDATVYLPGVVINDGLVAAIISTGISTGCTIEGLNSSSQYSFIIIPYTSDGLNQETWNYKTDEIPPSATATTTNATYFWSGPDNGNWTDATNWSPQRNLPANTDVLVFNDGNTKTIMNVPTQTIAQCFVANFTSVTLKASANVVLTIAGGDGDDFLVGSGSSFMVTGTSPLRIAISNPATALIYGDVKLSGGSHGLVANAANGIVFAGGSSFTAGAGFTGTAFSNVTPNAVTFQSGSTYIQQSSQANSPFGLNQPNSVVVFSTGSLYRHESTSNPAFSGRIYANFELNIPLTFSPTGVYPCVIDKMHIAAGTLNFNLTGGLTIQHNIDIESGSFLNFSPLSNSTVTMNSQVPQSISGQGTLTIGPLSNLIINNSAGITLNSTAYINGILTLSNSLLTLGSGNLYIGPSAQIAGSFSATNMIVATGNSELRKEFPESFSGSFLFPVGDSTDTPEYSPVSIAVISGFFQTDNYIGVKLTNAKYPTDPNTNSYLNRYWNLSQNNIEDILCSVSFKYSEADVNGIENIIYCVKIDPIPIIIYNQANTTNHELIANNLTNLGTFTGTQIMPNIYHVSGGGKYCMGGTGLMVTLENSEPGVMYQIKKDGIDDGAPVFGTGLPITWQNKTSGTYTIEAINLAGSIYMDGSAIVEEISPQPVNVIIVPDAFSVCSGNDVTFTAIPFNGGNPDYQWFVNSSAISDGSPTFTYTPTDGDYVQVYMTSSLSCISGSIAYSNVVTMSVSNALVVPEIAGPASTCSGVSGYLYSTYAGMSDYIWNISSGGTITSGGSSDDASIIVTWNQEGEQWVSLSYTSQGGCVTMLPTVYMVTVNPNPVPQIVGPIQTCVGNGDNQFSTNSGMSNYIWTVSAGGSITSGGGQADTSVQITWSTSGSHVVSVDYTNSNGCFGQNSTYHYIEVYPLPEPVIAGPADICVFTGNNLYTTQAGMSDYSWNISPGGHITEGGGVDDPYVIVTWNVPGPQVVSVNYTNLHLCRAAEPIAFPVNVNSLPVPDIMGSTALCQGSESVLYIAAPGMSSYEWIVSPGGVVTSGGSGSDNTISVTWNSTGLQQIAVSYTNENGCTSSAPGVLEVLVNSLPTITISGPTSVCLNSSSILYETEGGLTGYIWSVSEGGSIVGGGEPGSQSATVSWNLPGEQFISLNYTDQNGCSAVNPTVFNIIVHPLPVPTITGQGVLCIGSSDVVYFTDEGKSDYNWTVSEGGVITSWNTGNMVTINWNQSGTQSVAVNYTDENGCVSLTPSIHSVVVNPLPIADAGTNAAIYLGTSVQLSGNGTGGSPPYQFNWTPAESLSNSLIPDPVAFPTSNTTYNLVVTDVAGCSGVDTVSVVVMAPPADISGNVSYLNPLNSPMNNVIVTLEDAANNEISNCVTNQSGSFYFAGLLPGIYHLKASCTKQWGGVNSNDALIILKHFTMLDTLTGLKLVAADVNADHSVNSIDAFLASKRFVFLITSFLSGDWVFETKEIIMNSVNVNCTIKALCYGDVSGSYTPPSTKPEPTIQAIPKGILKIEPNTPFELPVSVDGSLNIGAMSLIFNFNDRVYTIDGISMNKETEFLYHAHKGVLRISWYSIVPQNSENETLLTLKLHPNDLETVSMEDINLTLDPESEFGDCFGNTITNVKLLYPQLVKGTAQSSFSAYPIPASKNMTLAYTLPEEGDIEIILISYSGTEIACLASNVHSNIGPNMMTCDVSTLSPGSYIARIYSKGKTMIWSKDCRILVTR